MQALCRLQIHIMPVKRMLRRKCPKPQLLRCAQSDFESWIQSNPLPFAAITGPEQRPFATATPQVHSHCDQWRLNRYQLMKCISWLFRMRCKSQAKSLSMIGAPLRLSSGIALVNFKGRTGFQQPQDSRPLACQAIALPRCSLFWMPISALCMYADPAVKHAGKILCQLDVPAVMLTTDDRLCTPEDLLLHMPSRSAAGCCISMECPDHCSQGNSDDFADAVRSQHLIALLVADAAAIGIWRNGALLRHRVLTGYTVRKQQGKAQQAYQRQGGGEAGSPHKEGAPKAGEHASTGQSGLLGAVRDRPKMQRFFKEHSRAVQVSL